VLQRKEKKDCSPTSEDGVSQGKAPQRRDLQPKILPQWGSALKLGLREVQPGSTPSGHTAELPSPVLPGLTGSFPQVLHQWFRLGLNSYHTVIVTTRDFFFPAACLTTHEHILQLHQQTMEKIDFRSMMQTASQYPSTT